MRILLNKVEKLADTFQEIDKKLTSYERLSLAIQMQRNELLAEGLCISSNEAKQQPVALEKIAMEMESSQKTLSYVHDSLNQIARTLEQNQE